MMIIFNNNAEMICIEKQELQNLLYDFYYEELRCNIFNFLNNKRLRKSTYKLCSKLFRRDVYFNLLMNLKHIKKIYKFKEDNIVLIESFYDDEILLSLLFNLDLLRKIIEKLSFDKMFKKLKIQNMFKYNVDDLFRYELKDVIKDFNCYISWIK